MRSGWEAARDAADRVAAGAVGAAATRPAGAIRQAEDRAIRIGKRELSRIDLDHVPTFGNQPPVECLGDSTTQVLAHERREQQHTSKWKSGVHQL